MKREMFIKEIEDYQEIISWQLERQGYFIYFDEPMSEIEWVYHDILDYIDNEFEDWTTKDFKEFIHYLEDITGLKTKLGGM